jgi:hypothetical protein
VIDKYLLSGCAFGLEDDVIEHLVDFCVVLHIIREKLASKFEHFRLLVVSAPHQDLESLQLQLCQLKLLHIRQQDGLSALDLPAYIGGLVDHPFDL